MGVPRERVEIPRQANGACNRACGERESGTFAQARWRLDGATHSDLRVPNLIHDVGFSIVPKRKPEAPKVIPKGFFFGSFDLESIPHAGSGALGWPRNASHLTRS